MNLGDTHMKSNAFALPVAASMFAGAVDLVQAQTPQYVKTLPVATAPLSMVPRTAYFLGLGGSFNSTSFTDQNIFAQGVSDIFLNGTQVAFGSAGGPADPSLSSKNGLSPTIQAGFFRHFTGTDWLWGAKVSYAYLHAGSIDSNVVVPQVGSFTSANSDTFTGNVVIRSYQTSLEHQLNFIPFVGHSFDRSMVYFGVGPALFQTRSKLNGVIGFAAINNTHVNITGTPSDFSSSQWMIGGAATVGGTYFLSPSWFLDFSYTFAMSESRTTSFSAPFASATDGYTDTGILSGDYSGRVVTQSVAVSINKAF